MTLYANLSELAKDKFDGLGGIANDTNDDLRTLLNKMIANDNEFTAIAAIQKLELAKKTLSGAAPAVADFSGMSAGEWCWAEGTGGVMYLLYEDDGGHYQATLTAVT